MGHIYRHSAALEIEIRGEGSDGGLEAMQTRGGEIREKHDGPDALSNWIWGVRKRRESGMFSEATPGHRLSGYAIQGNGTQRDCWFVVKVEGGTEQM